MNENPQDINNWKPVWITTLSIQGKVFFDYFYNKEFFRLHFVIKDVNSLSMKKMFIFCILGVASLIYVLLASGEIQKWNNVEETVETEKKSNKA